MRLKLRKLRGRTIKLRLKLKSKEIKYIVTICFMFWVAVKDPGQEIGVHKLAIELEALPTAVQSEAAEETPDTGCDGGGYEIYYSAEDGTLPES